MKKEWAPGFTIVELLIVVVVIAILAAITIVSYNGITNRANDTAVSSDLTSLKKKVEIFIAENGRRPNSLEFPAAVSGFRASKGSYAVQPVTDHNLIYCSGTGETSYALIGYSKSGNKFSVTNTASLASYVNAWTNQTTACAGIVSDYSSNYRGYAGEDTSTGPWRSWTGS